MPGGLMQIASHGAEDIFLTRNPQITFFKLIYRRYTNFAMDNVQQNWTGRLDFGGDARCYVNKVGDVVWQSFIEIDLPEVDLKRVSGEISAEFQQYYGIISYYVRINLDYCRKILTLLQADNISLDNITQRIESNYLDPVRVARRGMINAFGVYPE